MVLEVDVLEYCRKLRNLKEPPYTCPIQECAKPYKTMCGLQYHLVNFTHPTLTSLPELEDKPMEQQKQQDNMLNPELKKALNITQKYVEIEVDDRLHKLDVTENFPIISRSNYDLTHSNRTPVKAKTKDLVCALPQPCFKILDDYNITNAPPKPVGYIRFIEKSVDDMDEEVEYDLDEEDVAWLEIVNSNRKEKGLEEITVENFELLMDRLEKESYFQMQTTNKGGTVIDDDAICCICLDGDCQNTNAILFCDMCNLAVHQDCYGVPYIPEGQWLCRRCLHSPSRVVDCVLCPNTGGAFKQTDRGHWAHVVCALWIPEVRFANAVFLEPIDSIETIPAARWRLTCYLCKHKGIGACIQCHRPNCYSAFHVTCAQHAGLYMKMDAIEGKRPDETDLVTKVAYCESHTPTDAVDMPKLPKSPLLHKPPLENAVSIPIIPPDKIQEIGDIINISKKNEFVRRLIAYWTLKRQLRNGVPLLRSLQSSHGSRKEGEPSVGSPDLDQLRDRYKYWNRFRQDLEKARLLCELVRKREKLKRELVRVKSECLELELCPVVGVLRHLVDTLRDNDTGQVFLEPVDLTEVPDYSQVVHHPMDLSTMRNKVDSFQYATLQQFRTDFELMIDNCLSYGSKDSVFHQSALKMKQLAENLFQQAEREIADLTSQVKIKIEPN
jgi:bromodomain and PHD finger-containing protein 1